MTVAAVLLDFDGVIVESVDIKTDAFFKLFSFAPSHVSEIVQYHAQNAGISRFEKFRYIYKNILKENLSDAKFDELSERFSSLVIDAVVEAPLVPGAGRFLEHFSHNVPLYVISATPQGELREIVRRRQMDHFFQKVLGSPAKKTDNIKNCMKTGRLDPAATVYVGDAVNDLNAAHAAGVRFIGRIRPGLSDPFQGLDGVEFVVRDLDDLTEYIGGQL